MVKTAALLWILAVLVVAGQSTPHSEKADRPGRVGIWNDAPGSACSGFSREQKHRTPPLSWRFRSCASGDGHREVQVQFRNRSKEVVTFDFRLWTERLRRCDDGAFPRASGTRTLGALQKEEWPYTRTTIPAADFSGQIWVCVKEVGQ